MPTKRAAKVAAPGAARLTLTGIAAVSDDFGRVRILLLDEGRDGRPDGSARALRAAVGVVTGTDFRAPHELRDGPLPPSAEGVRGACWAVPPAHRRAHWLGVATALRGQWVRAEVTVRRYAFARDDDGTRAAGVALDLAMLEALPVLDK
jgi:hypothetical protein